jgi:hypothetical protein
MPRRTKKIEEVVWGMIKLHTDPDGIQRKHFFPNSRNHFLAVCNRFPMGQKIGMIPVLEDLSFSDSQRAYHFVLCGYLAHEVGYTKDDAHDDAMKEVFGIRTYKNHEGIIREGRYSISDIGGLKLPDVQNLINRDLAVCAFLNIVVPTKAELGYIDTDVRPEPIKNYPQETYKKPLL